MDPIKISIRTAASGLFAQSKRLQTVSENLANANSTSSVAGGRPYSRKTIAFEAVLDETTGDAGVRVSGIERDKAPFRKEIDPGHPAADDKGVVMLPNVNPLVELADLRESNRMYEANLQVIRQSRELASLTIDLLKATS